METSSNQPDPTQQERRLADLYTRLEIFDGGARGDHKSPVAIVKSKSDIADRIRMPHSRTRAAVPYGDDSVLDFSDFKEGDSVKNRVRRKLEEEGDLLNSYYGFHGVVEPEYDMLEGYAILDCESFSLRANKRKHNLMFRNGFTFTSTERPQLADYANQRAKQISYVMRNSFQNFLKEILMGLLINSNAFLIKIRDEEASGGKKREGKKAPVAAYQIIPSHTIFPFLDGFGHIKFWRRFFGDGRPFRDYDTDDIVHLFWDRKPGHIFGTPRWTTVKDDIYALRRIEENAELLLVSYMFPFTHIKIGTPDAPCQYLPNGTSEVDMYRNYVSEMPKEGVLVTDERVEVDIQGGEGKGVDSKELREHYKKRIYIGYGVSPIDMGESDAATGNSADNVSQNLKDDVKADLAWFCDQIKYSMIFDWFEEAPFKVSVQNAVAEVNLEFHELDPDTQIKMESHHLNMFNNHALTHPELRGRMKLKPVESDQEKDTHFQKHVMSIEKHRSGTQKELLRMKTASDMAQTATQAKADEKVAKANVKLTQAQVKLEHAKAKHQSMKNEAPQKPTVAGGGPRKSGGRSMTTGRASRNNPLKTASPKAKVTTNVVQPRNQHGVNLDPHKAKSSLEFFPLLHDELIGAFRNLQVGDRWEDVSRQILQVNPCLSGSEREVVWSYVSRATDEDLLYVYLKSSLS